jgi:hypothetical protein
MMTKQFPKHGIMDVVQYFRMRSITDTRELTMNYGSLYENYCVLFHSR